MATSPYTSALQGLRDRCGDGFVVTSTDRGWDSSRQAFNLAVDQRPALVVLPETADHVAAVVDFAREHGLRVAPQRTGHAADAIPSLADAVLLRTDRMRSVDVDPTARTVRAAGGANWDDVIGATAHHGLAPIAGSSPNVGVAGFHLGGGIGFLSRKHGIAASSLRAIELVTADGRQVRATADSEPELFWALRGGGGNFGVVTALELTLYPLPDIYGGSLFFPVERAAEVLHVWHELTLTAPEELTLSGRVLQVPDVDGPPPMLRGRAFALIDAVFLGGESAGAELLAPARALGPELDTAAAIGPTDLGRIHMDPEDPVPSLDDHLLLGALPPEAIDAFVAAAGPGSGSSLISAELRQTGGALSRTPADAGALATLPGEYFLFGVGGLMDPATKPKVRADLDRLLTALAPHTAGRYFNFSDSPLPTSTFLPPDVNARLQAAKSHWDPDDLFVAGHPVG